MLPTLGSRAARSAGLRIAAVAPAAHVSCAASSTAAAEHMADAAETEHYAAAATSYHKAFFYTGDYEAWQRKCATAHARAKSDASRHHPRFAVSWVALAQIHRGGARRPRWRSRRRRGRRNGALRLAHSRGLRARAGARWRSHPGPRGPRGCERRVVRARDGSAMDVSLPDRSWQAPLPVAVWQWCPLRIGQLRV